MTPGEPIMTGKERYPILGWGIPKKEIESLLEQCKGLKLNWDCEKKAMLVWKHINRGVLVFGEMKVWDAEHTATYGFEYHPPFEFHAWIEERSPKGHRLVHDLSLPGVVLKGLDTCDEIGPILKGRTPMALAGRIPKWAEYIGHEFYMDRNTNIFRT